MDTDDESAISEITILPDGRVYLVAPSAEILEMLDAISWEGEELRPRIGRLHAAPARDDNESPKGVMP